MKVFSMNETWRRGLVKGWVEGVELEDDTLEQAQNAASLPFIHKHVALMPDAHRGHGSTVGSVIPTKGAIIPAAVGVDIGCGMMAVRTSLKASDLPDNLAAMRSAIEAAVPHGRTDNGGSNDRGAWHDIPQPVLKAYGATIEDSGLIGRYVALGHRHPKVHHGRALGHLGTLGTGNHFVEVCLDEGGKCGTCRGEGVRTGPACDSPWRCADCNGTGKVDQRVWVMLHSGSRGPGNKIGSYFIERAKEEMRRWFINLPDADLAYLPEGSELFRDYVEAVGWAQDYARVNRELMMAATTRAIEKVLGRDLLVVDMAVNCHHNYVEKENHFGENVWVTRKGAVRARVGDLGIIPGSMGAKSFIVRGRGNPESFHSCSHGAGRRMSRTAAKNMFSLAMHEEATRGVECRKDADVIDETPMAYKNIDDVMAAQADLVEVVHTLKQVLCVKG
jgi:tRNA-splicing ligase RtcB